LKPDHSAKAPGASEVPASLPEASAEELAVGEPRGLGFLGILGGGKNHSF